jgi:single-stranded DNA-binding protein
MKNLTETEILEQYEKVIKPRFFENVPVSENKSVTYLGGQPGAGKSRLLDSKDTAVVIDSDLIRESHPKHGKISEKDIYDLDKECYKWGSMLIQDAIKEGKNIVFDGTLGGNLEETLKTMKNLKDNKYSVNVRVLATNDAVSKIGVTWRYEEQKAQWGKGRNVDLSYHDQIYQRLPENIDLIIKSKQIDELKIYSRDNSTRKIFVKPENSFDANSLQNNPTKPIFSFIEERTRPFKQEELNQLQSWAVDTVSMIERRGGDTNDFRYSIKTSDPNAGEFLKSQIKSISDFSTTSINKSQITMEKKIISEVPIKKIETLKGRLGSEIEFTEVKIKGGTETKKVATFSVADNSKGKEPVWHNVQMWEDKFPKIFQDIKKGDLVELKGYNKSFQVSAIENKTKTEFVATEILSHQAKKDSAAAVKEIVSIKGNLGQDPIITKTINDKTVAAFSIAVKTEGSDKPNWQQVQVWNEAIEMNKISELKKGDFVQLKGYYGNEYQNKMGETKQDFVLEESKVLKKNLENDFTSKRGSGIRI